MSYDEWMPLDSRPKQPSLNTASLSHRLWAGLFDVLVLVSFFIFLELLISWLPVANPETISLGVFCFFFFLYSIWTPYKTGATPGKNIFGLKLVQHISSERPGLVTVIFREVVLKPISVLSLGYLFWRFKSEDYPISLQDHYTDTRIVIDEDKPASNPLLVSLSPWLMPFVFIYTLLCLATPVPLLKIVSELRQSGIYTEGISGNAVKGFNIKVLIFNFKNFSFKATDLQMSLDYKELFFKRNLQVSQLSVGSLETSSQISAILPDFKSKNPYEFLKFVAPSQLNIAQINFSKFTVNGTPGSSLKVSGAQLRHDGSLFTKDLEIFAPQFTFNGHNISYNPSSQLIKINPSELVLKPGFFQKLTQDLPIALNAEINVMDIDKAIINLEIAHGQFRLFQNEKSFVLNITDLEIRRWFQLPWPIDKISLNYYDNLRFSELVKNPNLLLTQEFEVILQNKKFSLKRNPKKIPPSHVRTITEINCEFNLCLHHPDRSFYMQIDLANVFNDRPLKKLKIDDASRNHSYELPVDFLSHVYYNKNFSQLDINEKRIVAYDSLNLDLNASKVADEQFLAEVRQYSKNKSDVAYLTQTGQNILLTLQQDSNALNVYKALAYLQATGECSTVMSFPSELFTNMLVQQPKLREPIYKLFGLCARDPGSALTLFTLATQETSPDEETTYQMALAYYQLGRWNEALNFFARSLRFRNSPEVFRYLAHIHQQLGHQREAQFYVDRNKMKSGPPLEKKRSISSEKNSR